MSFLADTNIVSELTRRSPHSRVMAWAKQVTNLYLSVITVEEIWFGLSWKPNLRVQTWLQGFIETECIILPVTEGIAKRAGELRGQLQATGTPRSQADMLIAATAHVHGLKLVTRNVADFGGCGLNVFDPFKV